jgi:hypothetical protein
MAVAEESPQAAGAKQPHHETNASTKTISFTGCRFDLAQLADAEAAGAFARRPLHTATEVQIDTRCPAQR